jgi:hypothetical protein
MNKKLFALNAWFEPARLSAIWQDAARALID